MTRLAGVRAVSEEACPRTWTCRVQMKDGRLPDLKAWGRGFREEVGEAFSIRGVEVTVVGQLVQNGGPPALQTEGAKELLRLAPLRHKVQWDPSRQREQPANRRERNAYANLCARWAKAKGGPVQVRVVSALVEGTKGGPPVLEVREFVWRR